MNPFEPCLPNIPDPQQEDAPIYYCPVCGKEVWEDVYRDKESGLIIGCDQCIEIKKKEDVLDEDV